MLLLRRKRRQLRELGEAEVYARSYGNRSDDVTNVQARAPVEESPPPRLTDRALRDAFLERLDGRSSPTR